MKRTFLLMISCIIIIVAPTACDNTRSNDRVNQQPTLVPTQYITPTPTPALLSISTHSPIPASKLPEYEGMTTINITIDGTVFSAELYDNPAANALLERLPLTLTMSELNGNEKYDYLPDSLPADPQREEHIHTGDLMLYGSDCLVLFYESFPTAYSYTKIGCIEDSSGLARALGSGSATVVFAVGD